LLGAAAGGVSYEVAALTRLSIPSRYSMKKKRTAHNCGKGNIVIASGYVTKAKPGPKIDHPQVITSQTPYQTTIFNVEVARVNSVLTVCKTTDRRL
jgi:hypothetical protein